MQRRMAWLILTALALVLVSVQLLGQAYAAPPRDAGPDGDSEPIFSCPGCTPTPTPLPRLAVSSGFTYQGQLRQSGAPVNGTCDFQFALFNDDNAGAQLGAVQPETGVQVTNGVFTVLLNSGGEFGANAFDGDARWLRIAVRCPAGSGGYTVLDPRQPLTAAPYALSVRPGASVETDNTTGAALNLKNTRDGWGLYSEGGTRGLMGVARQKNSSGIYGQGDFNGVYGEPVSIFGNGVRGVANGGVLAWGVYGSSDMGAGVTGYSDSGYGVIGMRRDDTGTNAGVWGETASRSANAVGVLGRVSPSAPGGFSAGVRGVNEGTGGNGIGVWGEQKGGGWGVYGLTSGAEGTGVRGVASGTNGEGVVGIANNGSSAVGVYGESSSGRAGEFRGDVHVTGDLTRAYTSGTANRAAPIAYAYINSGGSVAEGTPNVSSVWNATNDRYEITIAGESYVIGQYITVVTSVGSPPTIASVDSVSGKLLIYIHNLSGTRIQDSFQFVTYRP